jgi:hypothetical protein
MWKLFLMVFFAVTLVRFILGKLKDPYNPAGLKTSACLSRLGLDTSTPPA